MRVYGIKTCDSCRRARGWLDERGSRYQWWDLREDGIEPALVQRWLAALGPEGLVNRRSTTWRGLSPAERERALQPDTAARLLMAYPTLIRRPVFEIDDHVLVGFDAGVRDQL